MRLFANISAIVTAAVTVLSVSTTQACTVCMGDPSSKAAEGANGAIFLMLGFVAVMFLGVGGFIFHLARRAKTVAPMDAALTPWGGSSVLRSNGGSNPPSPW